MRQNRIDVLVSVLLAIALAAPQTQGTSPDAAAMESQQSDAALARIRARLAKPDRLKITPDRDLPEPTFRIEIHQHPYFTEVPFIWTLGSVGGAPIANPGLAQMGLPSTPGGSFGGGTDILPLFRSLKRALDEHRALTEVQKAILEYCATHVCVIPQ